MYDIYATCIQLTHDLQIVTQLHTVFIAYYSEMSPNFASPAIPIQNFSLPRTIDEITLAHLVYKCLGKMASWTWQRIDKVSKEEYAANQAWVGYTSYDVFKLLFEVADLNHNFSYKNCSRIRPYSSKLWCRSEALSSCH